MNIKFEWDEKKDKWLKENRNISFYDVMNAIKSKKLIAFMRNKKYEGQYIIVVEINDYPWVVPCEFRGEKLRLITAYPSRKFKKRRK